MINLNSEELAISKKEYEELIEIRTKYEILKKIKASNYNYCLEGMLEIIEGEVEDDEED